MESDGEKGIERKSSACKGDVLKNDFLFFRMENDFLNSKLR